METKKGETVKKNYCNVCNKFIMGSSYKFNSHLYRHSFVKSRFQCKYCYKEYFRRDTYEKHVAVHTGIRKYFICDHCERSFVDKRNLITHLKIHDEDFSNTDQRLKCKACGVIYCEQRLLKYHIRKHHFNLHAKGTKLEQKKQNETWVERVKQSEICVEMTKTGDNSVTIKKTAITTKNTKQSKDISEQTKFQDYMTSIFAVTDKSQYSKAICDYCNKEMLKKSLKSHIRERHLKLKRFNCEVCKLNFSRHYQLVNHICGKFRTRKRN